MLIDRPGEQDVTNGGWDPNYWVNEGIKLHVQYLVLASFHSWTPRRTRPTRAGR